MIRSLDADSVEAALKRDDLPSDVRRVLEIRSLVGSASVKKLYAIENQTSGDDRLRGLIIHHGARTGRPTGSGPQPLNLPKAGPQLVTCEPCGQPYTPKLTACPWCFAPASPGARTAWHAGMVDPVLQIMATRSLEAVEYFFGDAVLSIMGCVRGLFQAGPGMELIASDYSAIEAVVAACVAGEQWRIETFKERKDIYLMSASAITGTTYEAYKQYGAEHDKHHPDRQNVGKVAELALGFGGWLGAWRAFDPDEANKSDQYLKDIILKWRDASPNIVEMWGGQRPLRFGIEGAAINAIEAPGHVFTPKRRNGTEFPVRLEFFVAPFGTTGRNALFIRLPSGRLLTYHRPMASPSANRPGTQMISYWTENTNPKYGGLGWTCMETWGSRIFENVVQAIAHDIQRHGIELCKASGYPMVLGVYDEDVFEVPEGFGSIEEVESLMATMPAWAQGWPIRAADGWRGKRYRK